MDYIDSNGLGELVQSLKTSKRYGASLRLLKPQDRVTKTLRLTNLLPMFSVYDTEADALKGLRRPRSPRQGICSRALYASALASCSQHSS